ncbi:hypothetical protein HJG60_009749 [Phyllostomus discolor]|uniref:Uncharacterized protein n=1 Tax=Phyllostomus discolor TaxID=89673 RepID=A0A834B8F9_9CHIR|nr:hypothetical protein HJG60_009749 [Phyllostomus discolor]
MQREENLSYCCFKISQYAICILKLEKTLVTELCQKSGIKVSGQSNKLLYSNRMFIKVNSKIMFTDTGTWLSIVLIALGIEPSCLVLLIIMKRYPHLFTPKQYCKLRNKLTMSELDLSCFILIC